MSYEPGAEFAAWMDAYQLASADADKVDSLPCPHCGSSPTFCLGTPDHRMLRYDEAQLVQVLAAETKAARAAFSAASAERLQPLYVWFHEVSGQGDPGVLRAALDTVWDLILGREARDGLQRLQDAAESLVTDDEDENWVEQTAYAQNAAAAVAYAVRSWISGDPEDAVLAATQLYEAADYAAQQDIDLNAPGAEDVILGQPVVQEALKGIDDDLRGVSRPGDSPEIVKEVRDTARTGGARLAQLIMTGT